MLTHNPKKSIEQLQIILSNPAKKIAFLFGAGISAKDKENKDLIETCQTMTETIINSISDVNQKKAIETIKSEIPTDKFNIETLLSSISEKEIGVGNEKLCGLNSKELAELRKYLEEKITSIVSVHTEKDFSKRKLCHNDFAKWIKNANRDFPVEIFTTNFDYLLESALEKQHVPYFDGFIGSYKAFFYPEWIEDDKPTKEWTKLWKLHGSLGWKIENKEIIREPDTNNSAIIYPSYLKYDHSRKFPYLSYMDRLSSFLKQDDTVLFVCGYSFGDDHINEMLTTSIARSRSAHIFVLKRSDLSENETLSKLAMGNTKVSVYAKNSGVIGGLYGEWKLEREPSKNESYNIIDYGFNEDAKQPDEKWTGKGDFILGNFNSFSNFLSLFYNNSVFVNGSKNE